MYQTMEEIEKQYDGNFVCMINCRKSEYYDVIGGEVIAAGKDKKPIIDIWSSCDDEEPYCGYVGNFPNVAGGFLL